MEIDYGNSSRSLLDTFREYEGRYPPIYYTEKARQYYYVPYVAAICYVVGIYCLSRAMRTKKAFNLKKSLIVWNMFLGVYSIIGVIRSLRGNTAQLLRVYEITCDGSLYGRPEYGTAGYWGWVYICSKLVELGDTLFLILRKKPVIFLHVYHHITVLLYTWFAFGSELPAAGYFAIINGIVHSIMYPYYTAMSLKIPVSVKIPIILTSIQIFQMFLGVSISVYAVVLRQVYGTPCDHTLTHSLVSFALYFSYLILFSKLFKERYIGMRDKLKKA